MSSAKVTIGLTNPKSPTNVGAALRAAGCFEADSILYTGERYARAEPFYTDTQDAWVRVPCTGVHCLLDSAPEDAAIVCVELVEGAIPLSAYRHPERAFYIFGPEDGTISQRILDRADAVVYIPTTGCLNLAATVNIVLYDRSVKSPRHCAGNALIRSSRDANNRTRIKSPASTDARSDK